MIDSPLLVWLFLPVPIAKIDVKHYPLVGNFVRLLQCIYVERGERQSLGEGEGTGEDAHLQSGDTPPHSTSEPFFLLYIAP
jgi:1-acyl-sn-glycerol-3-phosphate acyltransferase